MSFPGAQSMYQKMLAQRQAAAAAAGTGGAASSEPPKEEELVIEPPCVKAPEEGVLVFFGSTNWREMGKKVGVQAEGAPNLLGPHRLLAGLGSVKLCFIACSPVSAHIVALGVDGEAFTWGRNDMGQLGLGDAKTRCTPTRVAALDGQKMVAASAGKAHTVFVSSEGTVCACGANKQGCVGTAGLKNKKSDFEATPVPIPDMPPIASVASGSNFNLARDQEGDVWAWGWSEHGVLGNGSDGQFNKSDSSIKLSYEPHGTPTKILKLKGKKTVQVACGSQHCVSVSADGTCYTWGNGDNGRLGHKDQQPKWVPSELPELRVKQVAAGVAHTFALGYHVLRNGQVCKGQASVFMWGRCKGPTQDNWMYPKPEDDLRGWNVHCFDVGYGHNVVHADDSVISWGSGTASGELGYGEGGKKSSARPDKVNTMEKVKVAQIACGVAYSVLLVERSSKVDALPEFTPVEGEEEAEEEEAAPKGKGKGKSPAAGGKRKAEPSGSAGKKGKK